MGPLSGIRIVDMTTVLMGPYATQMLGDYGADVIKVEEPAGDVIRYAAPQRSPGMGALFLNANRSKRSISLNLKSTAGRIALLRLCESADVLVYNVRPEAMSRLGLSYEDVSAVNPRLIYAGLLGYARGGPYSSRPAYDDLIQGACTIPYLTAKAGGGAPRYVPTAVADRTVGLHAVNAILASLVERGRSGLGQQVDIPMFETMVSFILADHLQGLTFDPPIGPPGYARQLSPERRPYETRDGYICVMIYTDAQWRRFFASIGMSDAFADNPRFKDFSARTEHVDEVYGTLAGLLKDRTTADWLALFETADIPAMPMHDIESVLQDPHLVETGFFRVVEHPTEGRIVSMAVPAQWSRTPAAPERLAPRLGEDGPEVLSEAGFMADEITDMTEQGVLGQGVQGQGVPEQDVLGPAGARRSVKG